MRKLILLLSVIYGLSFVSCSTDEVNVSEEKEDFHEDIDPINPEAEDDSWRIINIAGKWQLDYIKETNHDGIHVGTTKYIESTDYNYVEYDFKENKTFIETTVMGTSSEDVEFSIRKGTYKAHIPKNMIRKYLELRYENGDWDDSEFEFNYNKTQIKIDAGTTTDMNCGCSENKYDYEEVYSLIE